MSDPFAQVEQANETTVEPSVDPVSARVWTTLSNASAYSNSKESRISNVFGNKKNKSRAVAYARVSSKRQAEDGIRDFCLSRGLGDVYKRQIHLNFDLCIVFFISIFVETYQELENRVLNV